MKIAVLLLALLAGGSAAAQATNDDTSATENWWDKVGADFFGAGTLFMPRPEYEIRAQWTALSGDDQAAILARCAAGEGRDGTAAASVQEGDEDNDPDTTEAERADIAPDRPVVGGQPQTDPATTTTGSLDGQEKQRASADADPAPYTGLAGAALDGAPRMVRVCDLIAEL